MNWILRRLGENSTWRGLAPLIAMVSAWVFHKELTDEQTAAIVSAGFAVTCLINIFRKGTKPGGQFNPNAEVRRGIPIKKA